MMPSVQTRAKAAIAARAGRAREERLRLLKRDGIPPERGASVEDPVQADGKTYWRGRCHKESSEGFADLPTAQAMLDAGADRWG